MLAQAEYIEPELIGEFDLLQEFPNAADVPGGALAGKIERRRDKTIYADLHDFLLTQVFSRPGPEAMLFIPVGRLFSLTNFMSRP